MSPAKSPHDLTPFEGNAFVPTMGALHEGHLALIRRARAIAGAESRAVVVSIFVNPTQFNDPHDLERYPRDLEGDCAKAEQAGADVIFAPSVETMYPPEEPIPVPPLPDVATRPGLEDAFRPGHFEGVCQVVARLFDLVQARWAVFGEKDYQQLKVIEAMVRRAADRWKTLEIVSHPTVREEDGLAMSSRNQLLSPEARSAAGGVWRALCEAEELASPARDVRRVEEHMRAILVRHQLRIDYAVVRDAQTLLPIRSFDADQPRRALIAARAGDVRLIDNESAG